MSTTPHVVGISYKGTTLECWSEGFLRTRSDGTKYFWATGRAQSGKYVGALPVIDLGAADELIAADLRAQQT